MGEERERGMLFVLLDSLRGCRVAVAWWCVGGIT